MNSEKQDYIRLKYAYTLSDYKKDYIKEKRILEKHKISAIGINKHLQSFQTYIHWRNKQLELFSSTDKARDIH